jgi:dolichol-phosphate mannosyltransferase
MKKTLVIIPTYNEIDNIGRLIDYLLSNYENLDVLIIDDNSPDGTGNFIERNYKENSRVKLIKRSGKLGLGTAYVLGFKYMLDNNYDLAVQMDADFSHDPAEIKNFLREIENYDLVIGSRYITGVNVINWPMRRLLLSYFANIYTRIITGMPIKDATGGYKCFRKEALQSVDLNKIKSNGYSFQIEMNFIIWKKGFRIKEIPIIFVDRVQGISKMSKKIAREAFFMVWKLRLRALFGRI